MKKLLLLFLALLCVGGSGAWADGLLPSTTEGTGAEYQYMIFSRYEPTYYLGNTTNSTSIASYGLFAFYAAEGYTNGYFIYSILEGKWVSYEAAASYSPGTNRIVMTADKPTSPWNIAADNTDNKYYDIRAFKTDGTVANMSWNWYDGASSNASNTMGFYDYSDQASSWGIVLAGGSGSPVADRKVVALYNVPNDNNLYALYNSDGTPKVYNATGKTPQYFILRQNGLDDSGEALYRIQKAEGDGNYWNYQSFGSAEMNFLFLNTSSSFSSYYTYESNARTSASVAPYYDLFRKWPNSTDNSSRPYSNMVSQCNDTKVDMYSSIYSSLPAPKADKGSWNGRWKVEELLDYDAWQVVMLGATSGTVTYSGSALILGGITTQSNNGIFVLNATPSASDFTASIVDGYCSDPTITVDSDRKIIKVAYQDYTEAVGYLATVPEGIGYPSATARTTLQSAVDVFNASSKTLSDYESLVTACNVFYNTSDINLPQVGKIYTIQSYVASSSKTAYLENVSGTLTISTTASETALNNLWVVRKSGSNVTLQSASDLSIYIIYSSSSLSETGSVWTLSKGTEWPYIAMHNSEMGGGRYVACNGSNQFGTMGSNNYYANVKTQQSGWSTDFKFTENTDYVLYTISMIAPASSTPTVSYNGVAYTGDMIAPTTLAASDLTVSEVDGCTASVTVSNNIIYVVYSMKPFNRFYRVKGYSGNYITKSTAGNKVSMNSTAGTDNIIYYDEDGHLIFYDGGLGMHWTNYVASASASTLNAYGFLPGSQTDKYIVKSNCRTVHGTNDGEYSYDDNTSSLNRNSSAVTASPYNTDFDVEAVTYLPVTFAGEYASFYSPVDLTIPEGVEVYTGTVNGEWLTLNKVEDKLPANTGVILKKTGEESTVNFTVLGTVTPAESALTGTVAAKAAVSGGVLVLGKNESDEWGIYNYEGALGGFKAYMEKNTATPVKGLRFDFGMTTGIETIDNGQLTIDAGETPALQTFTLAGQRVGQASRLRSGIYIVNGKKVVIK